MREINQRLELLALRLEVHGPEAAWPEVVRSLRPVALKVRNLLRSHGFTQAEIAELMDVHPPDCPCWRCLMALNKAVRNNRHLYARIRRRPK